MIKVLIVDDHPFVRRGVKQTIEEDSGLMVAAEAENGETALKLIEEKQFDVVVLDLSLPGISGLEVLERIREKHPALPVLILTMHSEEEYAMRVLKTGASGFLNKEAVPATLVEAIKKIAGGKRFITPSLAEKLLFPTETGKKLHESLSNRELQIMKMISIGKAPKEIAAELDISVKTVSSYRVRIMEKMGLKCNADLIKYCIEQKLL